uniref:RING-type domain-containing protein n=1 Tax=Panagrellus redivivus TaxID=6233 RepID=A0A7E4W260_PANRE
MATDLDISRCCVCYGIYNRTNRAPMSMPCGHTFCRGCIRQMTTEILFSCGICRTISPVGWVSTKKNVVLIQALEKMNLLATDDTNEVLESTPLGKTVDECQLHQVPTKDMLSYGKRSLQVLACHMKSRYDDSDEAVLAVDRAIVKIDGRLMKNGVSGAPASRPNVEFEGARLFEDAEVVVRDEPNRAENFRELTSWGNSFDDDDDMFYFNDYYWNTEAERIANFNRITNNFVARREHDMEIYRIRNQSDFQAAAVRFNYDDASDDDENDVDEIISIDDNAALIVGDLNRIDVIFTDDDDGSSVEASDDGVRDVGMSDDDGDVYSVVSSESNRGHDYVDVIDLTMDDDDASNVDVSDGSGDDDIVGVIDLSDDDDASSVDASVYSENDVEMSYDNDGVSSVDDSESNRGEDYVDVSDLTMDYDDPSSVDVSIDSLYDNSDHVLQITMHLCDF